MTAPFFSIIIPIYKVEAYLRQCVDSVLTQSFTDFEVILVDDGSPDGCPTICDSYAAADPRIHVIHKPNGGLSDARNAGLRQARGSYIIFLDSDDFYNNKDFFQELYDELQKRPVEMLCFQRQKFPDGNFAALTKPTPYSAEELAQTNASALLLMLSKSARLDASAPMKVLKRSMLIDNELFFRIGLLSEDIEWFMRTLMAVKSVAVTNSTAYCYRLRATSISHNITARNTNDLFLSIELYADRFRQLPDDNLKRAALNYLAYQYFIIMALAQKYLPTDERNDIHNRCKRFKWLSGYACNPKTSKCAMLMKIGGLKFTAFVLSKYLNIKN